MSHKHHSREEIAKIQIGHTDSTPAKNVCLMLFFLAVVIAVPLLQNVREFADIRAGRESGRRLPQSWDVFTFLPPSAAEWRAIATAPARLRAVFDVNARILRDIAAYETALEERDALMQRLVPVMQIPTTAWLRGGNEDAYCGRQGWLFYRRDIDSLTRRGFLEPAMLARRAAGGSELQAAPQPDPVAAIVHFREQLAARGIELLVMPAPVKPTLYPEQFSSRYLGREVLVNNPSFDACLTRLAAAGVPCFDPAPLLLAAKQAAPQRPLYLRTDTHWTPAGMEMTAAALAAKARQTAALAAPTDRYAAVETTVTNRGDVAAMLEFPDRMEVFAPETVALRRVTDRGKSWQPEAQAEVLVLGDSFANIYSLASMGWGAAAGLAEHLSLALGLPVDTITRNDAGSYATRETLARELRRGHDRLAGKKLVVWEFASRELVFGDWKLLPLTLGEPGPQRLYQPPAARAVTARAVVRAVSPAPRPGSVPYKDHLLMLHLTELDVEHDPDAAGAAAVAFAWSMRDNRLTAAAGYRPGERVELRLRRWSEVVARLEAINRSELQDEALLLAEPVWAELPAAGTPQPPEPEPPEPPATPPALLSENLQQPPPPREADSVDLSERLLDLCARRAADGQGMAIPGAEGWLFLRQDFRHLAAGAFWGEAAAAASQAPKPEWADPLPALVDLQQQLDRIGIDLLLLPVPPKAVIYPDKAFPEAVAGGDQPRLDGTLQAFYRILGEHGIAVLDLTDAMRHARQTPEAPAFYCRTDTHWSAYACELAARRLAARLAGRDLGARATSPAAFTGGAAELVFVGDLERSRSGDSGAAETIPARVVAAAAGAATVSSESPVLLLGDSHTLVFHAGDDMLATGAGLADQLALELGRPVDLLGVRGSAATPARVNLLRRARKDPSYLAGKKLVVYCFAAREFTESQGWRLVPIVDRPQQGESAPR